MDKILTIVIPTYNMEKYLRRCLDSLIISDKTLFEKLEVLVVNDGSKDSSSAIAHEYEKKYPRVYRVIDKENGNYGSCVNRGNKEAKGKYFRILDADDWFDTVALGKFVKSLSEGENVDVVITDYMIVDENRKSKRYRKPYIDDEIHSFDDYNFIGTANERLLTMHSITYSTALIHRIRLQQQEGISYTDIEYCYFPLVEAKQFRFVDVILYQYFVGREGQTVSIDSSLKHFRDYYLVANRTLNDFLEKQEGFTDGRKNVLSRLVFNPVVNLFLIPLVYSKKIVPNEFEKMLEIEKKLAMTPAIYKMLKKYTYSKIPFYTIWKFFHIRVGSFVGR